MAQTLQFKSITPGAKQLPWIVEPLGRLESYVYVTEQPTMVLAFATQ